MSNVCHAGHDKNVVGVDSSSWCKACRKEYNREYRSKNPTSAEKYAAWRERYKSRARSNRLRAEFGISLEEYNVLFETQRGLCKICKRHQSELKKALAVDHDHATGKIRGLLCAFCNPGLGYFSDNIQWLQNAIDYLRG